ncbi:uncharacterized protein LOC107647967 [Arachis ipaensis]|uniref:uncharacterized protein LOC107647967 n=1 Tax=Arachis ipaensis TaxID=130454 RepID=UPI0007AF86E5|nr:uncharacterized protein LOC107647967 [Arachis ipaensis]
MRSVMPGLVRESQSAFVKGRRIYHGALIACETVQWLKLKKKASAIIKLDFQKVYDRVKWCFIDTVLEKMGFGRTWRSWVRECVRTASISILINGSPSKPFKMERGLRQGDLLLPFLFVLVVDVLNRMIGEAVRNGQISPFLVGQDNIELSHLQFADDTILSVRRMRRHELQTGVGYPNVSAVGLPEGGPAGEVSWHQSRSEPEAGKDLEAGHRQGGRETQLVKSKSP